MKSRKKGFTLIELLVVIGIILLLASILSPALFRARESANRASCLANIRSIGQAMHIYASQSNDVFPIDVGWSANECYALLYDPKTFNETRVYLCPNRNRNAGPEYDPDTETFEIDSVGGDYLSKHRIISYVPVRAMDDGDAPAAPMATDIGQNVLIIEDPGAGDGDTESISDDENHGNDGMNVYLISGQAKWFRGQSNGDGTTSLPVNKCIHDIDEDNDLNTSEGQSTLCFPEV